MSQPYQDFSFALWVQPNSLAGPLIHVSTRLIPNYGWCFTFMSFDANNRVAAAIMTSTSIVAVAAPSLIPLFPNWTHIVQTWSASNGLRLYVNSVLVASDVSAGGPRSYRLGLNYLTLATSPNGPTYCYNKTISAEYSFDGNIDDLRVYSRELTSVDICTIYNS